MRAVSSRPAKAIGAVVVLVLTMTAAPSPATPARAAPIGDGPLDHAREAAERATFSGTVLLRWHDSDGEHSQELRVEAAHGVLVVEGFNSLMARQRERLVRSQQGWDLLWPSQLGPDDHPDVGAKYEELGRVGPTVAGRPTTVVELRRRSVLRERLYVDVRDGLLLERQQFDGDGHEMREVSFERLQTAAPAPPVAAGHHPRARPARRLTAAELPPEYGAPGAVGDGYRRLGVYRDVGAVHVLYGDGLYQLSMFEQRGRLDATRLPAGGARQRVGTHPAWRWAWAGGEVLVWQAGSTVYTAVGDAPGDELAEAAAAMPSGHSSWTNRVRRLCRALVGLAT